MPFHESSNPLSSISASTNTIPARWKAFMGSTDDSAEFESQRSSSSISVSSMCTVGSDILRFFKSGSIGSFFRAVDPGVLLLGGAGVAENNPLKKFLM